MKVVNFAHSGINKAINLWLLHGLPTGGRQRRSALVTVYGWAHTKFLAIKNWEFGANLPAKIPADRPRRSKIFLEYCYGK